MKTKNLIVLPLLLVLFGFSSCDDDDNLKVDQEYVTALAQKYPNATGVEWEKKGQYNVAECWVDTRELDVWFATGAQWVMTETELRTTDLPQAITTAIVQTEYATWRIDDVDLLEYPSKDKEYVVEVELGKQEMDLYFSESGELLRKKDVSGNADDTHWPV